MSSDYLKKPILTKQIETIKGRGFTLTTCEMQGWRRTMEDAKIYVELQPDVHLFAVLDGHGGPQVAQYVAQSLPKQILNQPYFKLHNYPRALTNLFRHIDHLLDSPPAELTLQAINQQIRGPPLTPNTKISHRAGTTAVVLLMTKHAYYVANIGDSRAVLCRNGQPVPLSTDHKPDLPSERNRIEKAGGFVTDGRVNGTLNLSRSFGDFEYKHISQRPYEEQCLLSEPEIVALDRSEEDEFVLLGCDGVWQRYAANNKKMIALVSQLRSKHESSKIVMDKLFGELVAKQAKELLGQDNMTAMLLEFY